MMDRRAFLTLAGGLGLTLTLPPLAQAAPNRRGLALLTGINDYGGGSPPLQGAVADLDLTGELLQYRYGFTAGDMLQLENRDASLEQWETAFREHLLNQAQPGDRVVLHFSGYGAVTDAGLTLKLADGDLPLTRLQALVQSLKTEAVTVILDCGFTPYPGDWAGNFRCRNPKGAAPDVSSSLPKSPKGAWLWGAPPGQLAAEWQGPGWQTGFFTYALTQTLWQTAAPQRLTFVFNRLGDEMIPQLGERQQPLFQGVKFPLTGGNLGASAGQVLQVLDSQSVSLTLPGALPDLQIQGLTHSLYRLGETGVEITEQNGRRYKGAALAPLDSDLEGTPVQEALRILPRNLGLTVALGENLKRIERVDATGVLESVGTVARVINSGEGPADCVLDKSTAGGYMLLSAGGVAFPQGGAAKSSAIKAALGELPRPLNTLLALKLLRLTRNEATSTLGVTATLERLLPTGAQPLSQRRPKASALTPADLDSLPRLAPGDRLQIRWQNTGAVPLYSVLVGLTQKGKFLVLLGPEEPAAPQWTQTFPGAFAWPVSRSAGWGELFLILSAAPFKECRQCLGVNGEIQELSDPVAWTRTLLADLSATPPPGSVNPAPEWWARKLAGWASQAGVYQ
ncbi:MAG: caspase family protein, partial [Cyanobacteriota bacterium]